MSQRGAVKILEMDLWPRKTWIKSSGYRYGSIAWRKYFSNRRPWEDTLVKKDLDRIFQAQKARRWSSGNRRPKYGLLSGEGFLLAKEDMEMVLFTEKTWRRSYGHKRPGDGLLTMGDLEKVFQLYKPGEVLMAIEDQKEVYRTWQGILATENLGRVFWS